MLLYYTKLKIHEFPKLICIFFYFHHTDRNHSIKSPIVTLTNLEKRMLIYVLELFDGGLKAGNYAKSNFQVYLKFL
jgi:hypothetical protein